MCLILPETEKVFHTAQACPSMHCSLRLEQIMRHRTLYADHCSSLHEHEGKAGLWSDWSAEI